MQRLEAAAFNFDNFKRAIIKEFWAAINYLYYLQYIGIGTLTFYGVEVLATQTYRYLREAKWVYLTVADLVMRLQISDMTNWLGLYAILQKIPASTAFFSLAIIWAATWYITLIWRSHEVVPPAA